MSTITHKYLLVIGIESFCDEAGRRYLDHLWYKDLVEHLRYIRHLTIASPFALKPAPENAVRIDDDPLFSNVRFVDLPSPHSLTEAILCLPTTISLIWKAVGGVDIVHSQVGGWPIPMGWLVTPIAKIRKKFYLIVVESAFWRLQPGSSKTFRNMIRAYLSEALARWCLNNADLSIFTQPDYKKSLLLKRSERGYVIAASWVDADDILLREDACRLWQEKLSASDPKLKVLFAGRLEAAKGILVLLDAISILEKEGISIDLDILGNGPLFTECANVCARANTVKMRMLGTVPYGRPLFSLLRSYHVVVVPSISDEQPRIVYDAYSQAIPILAADTDGLRASVDPGVTGIMARSNDPVALANSLRWSTQNMARLESMGLSALEVAVSLTHRAMHERRRVLIYSLTSQLKTRSAQTQLEQM